MEIFAAIGVVVVAMLIVAVMAISLITLASIINGYVLRILWGWFIIPVFHLPNLSLAQAIGFSMVIGLLTHRSSYTSTNEKSKEEKRKEFVQYLYTLIVYPLVTLGIGWIVHQFT